VRVLGEEDFVFRKIGAARQRVVEHEAVLEQHIVHHRGVLPLHVKGGFLLPDVLIERFDVLRLGFVRVGRELHAREVAHLR